MIPIVHGEAIEKWLTLWIYEIMTDRKGIMDSIVMRLKANETYHITQTGKH